MKPENKSETTSQSAVTSGGFRGKLSRRRNKALFIGGIVVVALLLLGFGLMLYRDLHPSATEQKVDTSGLPGDYSLMTTSQLETALKAYTHVTLEQLKNQSISSGMFDNYGQAYVAARVLANPNVNLHDKSLQVYKIADDKAGRHASEYQFYLDYAYEYLLADDKAACKTQLENAKTAVQNDKSFDSSTKSAIQAKLDYKIRVWTS